MYVIVYKKSFKRVRQNGVLTPVFEYPQQALQFIYKRLNNSQYVTIYKVGEHK